MSTPSATALPARAAGSLALTLRGAFCRLRRRTRSAMPVAGSLALALLVSGCWVPDNTALTLMVQDLGDFVDDLDVRVGHLEVQLADLENREGDYVTRDDLDIQVSDLEAWILGLEYVESAEVDPLLDQIDTLQAEQAAMADELETLRVLIEQLQQDQGAGAP